MPGILRLLGWELAVATLSGAAGASDGVGVEVGGSDPLLVAGSLAAFSPFLLAEVIQASSKQPP